MPAVGQGIIGIECRDVDARNIDYVRALNDTAVMAMLCQPSAHSRSDSKAAANLPSRRSRRSVAISCNCTVSSVRPTVSEMYRGSHIGTVADAEAIGVRLAEELLKDGAGQLLERLRQESP